MTITLYRATTTDIASDGRNLEGLALKWDKPSRVTDDGKTFYEEAFSPSSVTKTLKERASVPLPLGILHPWSRALDNPLLDEPVGSVRFQSTSEGLAFRARVHRTEVGDETLELVRSGELTGVSIGFVPYKSRTDGNVTVRTEVALLELSLAPASMAQHSDAAVLAIRASEGTQSRLRASQRKAALSLWLPL